MTEQQPVVSSTIVVREDIVFGLRKPFLLYKSDYQSLTKIPSYLPLWAHTVTAGSALYCIRLLSQYVAAKTENVAWHWPNDEKIFLISVIVTSIALQVINYFWPGEKRATMKKIEAFYESDGTGAVKGGRDE